jgi:excisionase family DNA binding protein
MERTYFEEAANNENQSSVTITEKRCYTVEDLQIILCVSRPTVYRLIRRNEFHSFQIGKGKWRISKKSFDAWLDSVS